jgi:ABC-2 type transport system ATP-binding protein
MDEAEYCDRIALIYRGELIALGTPGELKTKLMQEEVLEVLCGRPQDALEEITHVPGVKEVALFGRGLHVVAEDGPSVAARIETHLSGRGFAVERVEKIAPSLEDVFVSLIESHDRVAAPQQAVER